MEEIDNVLSRLAASCRFSSPTVRASDQAQDTRSRLLTSTYQRLSPRDAKWFTRLILKTYLPVELDHQFVFRCYHAMLPQMLRVRDDLSVATAFMRHIDQYSADHPRIASMIKPHFGTKVGRQTWLKGRSIKHCMDMGRRRMFSCEQKVDGEYCQIHIDLSKGHRCIQIFSKSGKDSTRDRNRLHRCVLLCGASS